MSCAALSIRAVRMAERGMDTRSETDESGGLNLSAAAEDKGQSSRQRDTMESTITCNGTLVVSNSHICRLDHGCEKKPLDLPGAPYLQLWQVHQPGSPVAAAPARPQTAREPAHTAKGRAGSTREQRTHSNSVQRQKENTTLVHFHITHGAGIPGLF